MKTLDVLQVMLAVGFIVAILPLAEIKVLRKVENIMALSGVGCVCLSMIGMLVVELFNDILL